MIEKDGDKVRIRFTSSSEREVISWILSFGAEANVLGPPRLAEEIVRKLRDIQAKYESIMEVL